MKITGADMLIEGFAAFLAEIGLPWHIPRTVSPRMREQSRKNLFLRDTRQSLRQSLIRVNPVKEHSSKIPLWPKPDLPT